MPLVDQDLQQSGVFIDKTVLLLNELLLVQGSLIVGPIPARGMVCFSSNV